MKKLLRFLESYRKEAVLAPLFKLFEVILELIVPLVIAHLVDVGIPSGDRGLIGKLCILLIALALTGLISAVTAQYFAARAATGFAADVRSALFSHIQSFSWPQLDQAGTSKLITRLTSDINTLQNGVNLALRLLLRSPFVAVGACVMAFTIDPKSARILAIDVPILLLIIFAILLGTLPLYKRIQSHLDRVTLSTRETITGVRVLRAFRREQDEIERFESENSLLTSLQCFTGRISALLNPATYLFINAGILILVYTGALRVNTGTLTTGQLIALYNYMSQVLVELIKLANLVITLTRAAASGDRVESILEMPVGEQRISDPSVLKDAPKVSFENVSFRYPGAAGNAVENISFSVRAGQTFGIIGGTGSGKSTLVHLIPGFYKPQSGFIRIDGADIRSMDTDALRARVGLVPQKPTLFSGTIESNLRFGNESASEDKMWQALRCAQAESFVREKEKMLQEPVLEGGANFSGGQKQRLTIARALVREPEILILDDSSSALDFATDAQLRAAIRALPWHPTVFIVSQRTSSIQGCDMILVLDNGLPAGLGRHEELLESCPLYREIHASQNRKENGYEA